MIKVKLRNQLNQAKSAEAIKSIQLEREQLQLKQESLKYKAAVIGLMLAVVMLISGVLAILPSNEVKPSRDQLDISVECSAPSVVPTDKADRKTSGTLDCRVLVILDHTS